MGFNLLWVSALVCTRASSTRSLSHFRFFFRGMQGTLSQFFFFFLGRKIISSAIHGDCHLTPAISGVWKATLFCQINHPLHSTLLEIYDRISRVKQNGRSLSSLANKFNLRKQRTLWMPEHFCVSFRTSVNIQSPVSLLRHGPVRLIIS